MSDPSEEAGREAATSAIGELHELDALFLRHVRAGTTLTDAQVLVAGLMTQALRLMRSIRILLEQGLAVEANAMNRALLETCTLLVHMQRHHERLEEMRLRMLFDTNQKLLDLAKFEKDVSLPLADEDLAQAQQWTAELGEAFAKLGITPGGLPDTRTMLRLAGRESRYWYYKRASYDLHANLVSVGSRMREVESGSFAALLDDPPATVHVIAMATADHFASAMICGSILLEWPDIDGLTAHRSAMDERLQEIDARAGRSMQEAPPEGST